MNPTEALTSTVLNAASLVSGRLAGAGAFALFHMPLARSRVRSAEREQLVGAHIGRVDVGGVSAVTYRWGDGTRPVLLVHGWQSRASRLSAFVPELLGRGHSVIAFDAPAHGDAPGRSTTIHDYRAVIAALHDEYGTFDGLVAHSLGALGSFDAMRHGVQARKVVTLAGVCDFAHLVDEFCSALRLRPRVKAQLHRRIERKLFPDAPAGQVPFSVTHTVGQVRSPILVVHDEDDTRIEPAQGRRLAAAFGDRARLVTTSGLGHRRILGDPEVVRTVLEFLDHDGDRAREAAADGRTGGTGRPAAH
ncbi:hypothetical protein GCM10027168_62850 [Streptomyces capparidis]